MVCMVYWGVILFLVCTKSCSRVCGEEVSDSFEVHISQDGIVTWKVYNITQSQVYFVVRVAGQGHRATYLNSITLSVKYYDLKLLNLSPGNYSIQIKAVSQQGTSSVVNYSKHLTYSVKDHRFSKENLIFILLPIIIVLGLLLGTLLLVYTVKSKSNIFACYHTKNQSNTKSKHQRVSFKQQRSPVNFESYRVTGSDTDSNHEMLHRRSVNISRNENEYAHIDSPCHVPLQELPHLYEAADTHLRPLALGGGQTESPEVAPVIINDHTQTHTNKMYETTTTVEVHHNVVAPHESSNSEQVKQTTDGHCQAPVVATSQCIQTCGSSGQLTTVEAQNDLYIEVFHECGTLI